MDFDKLSLREKIDTRENIIKQMRSLNDGCKDEKGEVRSFTAEEEGKYKGMSEDVRKLTDLIAKEKRELELKGFTGNIPLPEPEGRKQDDRMAAFRDYLRAGLPGMSAEARAALVVDGDGASASALAPQELVNQILTPVRSDLNLLSKVYTVHLSKAAGIGVPYEAADADDAEWTTEVPASITDESSLSYAKRELGAHALVKLVTISDKALKTNAFNLESIIGDKIRYKMQAALENAIINGSGDGQPLGLFTASASGLPADDDFTASSATALSADDIIKAKRSLKSAYRSRASWLFHPDTVTKLLVLKDKNDQYLWRSGLTASDPDMLDGAPVIESDFVPSTMTSGLYVGMFADFSRYWMTMVDSIAITRLTEKYYPSVGFSALAYADGQPVMSEAFTRIKMA
ncbi:MAG: phage major capsid protein [Treponema sp.]|nr:phage major capsid protein [Treponema sp.]